MADESNSTPSPAPATDPVVALVARWHEIDAARAATIDPGEQDRLAAEARDVEHKIAATRATTLVGALAALDLLARLTQDQPIRGEDHQSALRLALIESAYGIIASIDASSQQLLLSLKSADVCFEKISDHGRVGSMIALTAAFGAFAALQIPREKLGPLSALFRALEDAENGKRNAMLVPPKRRGSPPDEVRDSIAKAYAAVAMSLLMKKGLSEKAAAQYVHRKMQHWAFSKRKKFTSNTIRNWRERISGGLKHSDLDADTYFSALEHANSSSEDPKIMADNLLKRGPEF